MSIPAIVLAAGASRRLGSPKQLVELSGELLLRRTVLAVLSGCAPVLVVLGYKADEVSVSLVGLPVTLVVNEGWREGIGSSIRVGVEALPNNIEGALLFVCDQIALDKKLVMRLLEVQSWHSESIIACEYAGIRGTPAYFPDKDFYKLKTLSGDRGAGKFLQSDTVVLVQFPRGEYDIDCQEDLLKYLKFNDN